MNGPFAPAEAGPRIAALCKGFGGLDLGLQSVLGGRVVAYAEVKPAAVALLAARYPDVPNLGDLTVADWTGVEADIVTAGWPCQPHSAAGKRLGEEDPRAIWPAVLDVVRVVRPLLFVGENVARTATNGELRRALRSLAAIGYVGAFRCLPASDLGAPHKRDRLCLVAVDASVPHAEAEQRIAAWAEAAGGLGQAVDLGEVPSRLFPTPEEKLARSGPDYARAARPASGGDDLTTAITRLSLLPTPTARDHKGAGWGDEPGRPLSETVHRLVPVDADPGRLLPTPTVNDSRNGRNATANRTLPPDGVHTNHDGWTLCDVAHASRWREYAAAIERWEAVTGTAAPEPTQPSTRKPYGPQLSPRFVEWMMGVPKGWVTDGAPGVGHDKRGKWTAPGERNAFLSLLGDGVVPQWAAAQVAFLVPIALGELALLEESHVRDREVEVVVVAEMEPTHARLMHLARNARAAGLWSDEVRARFSARKVVVLQNALVREAKDAKDVDTLRALARRGRDAGLWSDEVREVFTDLRLGIEQQQGAA